MAKTKTLHFRVEPDIDKLVNFLAGQAGIATSQVLLLWTQQGLIDMGLLDEEEVSLDVLKALAAMDNPEKRQVILSLAAIDDVVDMVGEVVTASE